MDLSREIDPGPQPGSTRPGDGLGCTVPRGIEHRPVSSPYIAVHAWRDANTHSPSNPSQVPDAQIERTAIPHVKESMTPFKGWTSHG